jgi:hypothetical protein
VPFGTEEALIRRGGLCYAAGMKFTDDYDAKLEIWAREGKVHPLPRAVGLPRFGARRFNSHEEMNAWKRDLLDEIASNGGVQWTK